MFYESDLIFNKKLSITCDGEFELLNENCESASSKSDFRNPYFVLSDPKSNDLPILWYIDTRLGRDDSSKSFYEN